MSDPFATWARTLDDVLEDVERGIASGIRAEAGTVVDILVARRQSIRALLGRTGSIASLDDARFDTAAFETLLVSERAAATAFGYWVTKGQTMFVAGDLARAAEAFDRARPLSGFVPDHDQLLDCHFFSAMTVAASAASGSASAADAVAPFRIRLEAASAADPATSSDRLHLVDAEIARLRGQVEIAMTSYEDAIRQARARGSMPIEAIACEAASVFYRGRGLATPGRAYLERARACYLGWGAVAKVAQLDRRHSEIGTRTATHPAQRHDVRRPTAAADASPAASSGTDPSEPIERLMVAALRSAGARSGLLLLGREQRLRVRAEARTVGNRTEVRLIPDPDPEPAYPVGLTHRALRTGESVILHGTCDPDPFADDAYLAARRPDSVLAVPAIRRGVPVGVLYLEHAQHDHATIPDRIPILEVLADQAVAALEFGSLRQDLKRERAERARVEEELRQSENRVRQVVETIPTMAWTILPDGRIDFANRRWTDYTGISVQAAAVPVRELPVHPDDLDRYDGAWRTSLATGEPLEDEIRLRRASDGEYRRFLAWAIPLRNQQEPVPRWFGMAIDVEDRRRAVEELRQLQADFAHAARVVILGEMTASIAHELNQPLAAVVAGGEASVRWLRRSEPNVDEALSLASSMIADARRASRILTRIRSMLGRRRPERCRLPMNGIIAEALLFLQGELSSRHVVVLHRNTHVEADIVADRTQLQQVIVNLVMNAMQAMADVPEANRVVTVTVDRCDERTVRCTIEDRGTGIPAENASRLFESFFTTKEDGMGMGLAVSRSIIEAHGGAIRFDPDAFPGARVIFTLPDADAAS